MNASVATKPVLSARGLVKRFGSLTAVAGVDFDILEGECFGFLGPNGAGKTTTVKMSYGFSPFDSGTITVAGRDIRTDYRAIRAMIGICPQEDNLDPDFTVRKNLLVYARYFDIPAAEASRRADELLEFFQLSEKKNESVNALSGGMKRRLVLARALLNKPKLLILDEPTTGLDPAARRVVWDAVIRLRREGLSILLTTHYMEEAMKLCDRLVVMDHGRIVLQGVPAELVAREIGKSVIEIGEPSAEIVNFVQAHFQRHQVTARRIYIYSNQGDEDLREFEGKFALDAMEYTLRHATLEDVFLKATGHTLRD